MNGRQRRQPEKELQEQIISLAMRSTATMGGRRDELSDSWHLLPREGLDILELVECGPGMYSIMKSVQACGLD